MVTQLNLYDVLMMGLTKPVLILGDDNKIIDANDRMKEILQLPPGFKDRYLFEIIDDETALVKLTQPDTISNEPIVIKHNKDEKKYLLQIETVKTENATSRVVTFDDVNPLLKKHNILLNKLEDMICSVIQPLTEAVGYHELSHKSSSTGLSFHKLIDNGLKELSRLIDKVQCFIYMLKGDFPLNIHSHDISKLIKDLADSIVPANNVELILDINPNLKSVQCDYDKIQQALYNIIDNAVKHSPESGKVFIQATNKENFVEILIRDEGCGISADKIPTVMDDYFESKNNGANSNLVPGVGLALARKIIQAHNGTMWIDSNPGQGCTVHICLLTQDM